jgi:hypothetical protein
VSAQKQRRLVVGEEVYLYSMGWTYDRDGERIVTVAVSRSDDSGRKRRGQPVRARFVSREAEYPAPSAVALPGDVRAVVDRARELGWDGSRQLWLLPECGLQRPDLVLAPPTRLREWAGERTMHCVSFEDLGRAPQVAGELVMPFVEASRGAAEPQWRDDRRFMMRSRWGRYVSLYALTVGDLVEAIAVIGRRIPESGLSVDSRPSEIHGPTTGEVPASDVIPPERWATKPEARRYRGPRDKDVVWTYVAADGPRVEGYCYHSDAPDRLWRWISIADGGSVERRFRA